MKNIRFYEAEKYKTADYEIVDEKIYKTYETGSESDDYLGLEQLLNDGNEEFVYVSVTAPPINFGYAYKDKK